MGHGLATKVLLVADVAELIARRMEAGGGAVDSPPADGAGVSTITLHALTNLNNITLLASAIKPFSTDMINGLMRW